MRSRRRCPRPSSRCWRPLPRSRSATPTGCSRSSGMAIGSRPSSRTARSGSGPATSRTPRRTFRASSRHPPGSMLARPSSMARSSPSIRLVGRISVFSRSGLVTSPRRASSIRRSICCTWMVGRSSTSPSRIANVSCAACSGRIRAFDSPPTWRPRESSSTRRPGPNASKVSSPNCAVPDTSRVGGRRPG